MKALLYARVSRETQGAFSIETQLQKCRKKADDLGVGDFAPYIDNGFTVDSDRPGFKSMIADYQDGDIIIALSSDRLFGNFSEAMDFRKQYKLQLVLTGEEEVRPADNPVPAVPVTEPNTVAAMKPSNEAQQKFLAHIAGLINFWDQEPKSSREKLTGLAVSILSSLDRWAEELPGLIFAPDLEQKDGSENNTDITSRLYEQINHYLKK